MELMEKNIRWICISLIGFVLLMIASMARAEESSPKNAAIVNGAVVTQMEVEFELDQYKRRISKQNQAIPHSQLPTIRNKIVEDLINKELLYQESQSKGIHIEDTVVENYVSLLKGKFSNQGEFEKALKDMNITMAVLKMRIKKGYAIQQLIESQILKKLAVTEKESRSFYDSHPELFNRPEQVKASHILIKLDSQANEQQKASARERIKEIQKKLSRGEEFSTLAEKFSEGSSSANGGDLGYFKRGQMVKPFEEAAFALKPGEVSNIVETRFGYHLIKVFDKTPEKRVEFKEIKNKIDRVLKQEKMKTALQSYLEKLKETADIKRF